MEYCGLGSLDKYVTKKKLDVPTKVSVLSECARGLYHLHAAGIVHRDIAMRNILVGQGGVPKISDFGMSRTIVGQSAENKTASNVGPLKWMAPESLRDRVYGTKTDVYTYGLLPSFLGPMSPHCS
jgi:serine/threonine protein kinase